mgnify:CR=1 FL=1
MAEISPYYSGSDRRRHVQSDVHTDISVKNSLIATLPALQRGALLYCSKLVELCIHDTLDRAGEISQFAYFPVEGFVSVIFCDSNSNADMEVATVGREGMFNLETVLATSPSTFSTRVQGTGRAIKVHRNSLILRRTDDSVFREILLRYIGVQTNHIAQRIKCMHSHNVTQRLIRALLMCRDRANTRELFINHDSLVLITGACRESVSYAAYKLQKDGLISYARGYIVLLDEAALEADGCACYNVDRQLRERIFSL